MRTNLSPDRELFVGRHRECAALERSLRDGERLISIIAPSGTGKTRLAKQIGLRLELDYGDDGGVWFCDLSAARKADDLVVTVAMALGLSSAIRSGEGDFVRALRQLGSTLLILDNFESLEPQAAILVESWLKEVPNLQVLVTSLSALGIRGESLFELGPLAADDAIALYEDRARRAWAGERVFFSGEQRALGELVQRLDRLPLAIELAAARVRVLPPRVMLSKIEDRFELLQSKAKGRHSSLEYAIQTSWELLETEERLVLSRASVFAGGFTLEAAEGVLASGNSETAVLPILEDLREKALVQLDSSDPPRFSLYESLQAFAARELERSGGAADAKRQHAAFFIEKGEGWVKASRLADGPAAIVQLLAERDNLLAVHRRFLESEPVVAVRAALVANVATASGGSPAARLALLDAAVEAARASKDTVLLARVLRARSEVLWLPGRVEEGLQDLEEALELVQGQGRVLEGYINADLGRLHEVLGDLDEAERYLKRAVEIEREHDEPPLAGEICIGLGIVADRRTAHRDSHRYYEEARDIFGSCGDLHARARALSYLGETFLHVGDFDRARAALLESVAGFQLVRDPRMEAGARLALGTMERTAGRLKVAEEILMDALQALRRQGNHRFESIALTNLALIAMEQDRLHPASQRLEEALLLMRETGDKPGLGRMLPFIGALHAILGRTDEADAEFEEARSIFKHQGSRSNLAVIEILEGFLDLAHGRIAALELRADEVASRMERAAARLRASEDESTVVHDLITARRLLGRALARYLRPGAAQADGLEGHREEEPEGAPRREGEEEQQPPGSLEPKLGEEVLRIAFDASWFELGHGPRVKLGRSDATRRLLHALVEQHLLAPGIELSLEQLAEAGWPGENADPDASANRVYKCVNGLRRTGLEPVLLRHAEGYLLQPQLPIFRQVPGYTSF